MSKNNDGTSDVVDLTIDPVRAIIPKHTDSSNPFSSQQSDHPGLLLISKPLNGDNYSAWRRSMTLALNAKNKLGFVDGSIKPPSEIADREGYATWSRCNDMVHSWIINTLSPEISNSVIYYATAREVWEDLREHFSQSNAPRIFKIQREISYYRQDQLPISVYYTKLKSLWDELATYADTSSYTCGAQYDRQGLMQFLMRLNESYGAIRGHILMMNPLPSVWQAYSLVFQEEKQRLIGASNSTIELNNLATVALRKNNNMRNLNHFQNQQHIDDYTGGGANRSSNTQSLQRSDLE